MKPIALLPRPVPALGLVLIAATPACRPDRVNATVIHAARFDSTPASRPRKFLRATIDSIRWSGLPRIGSPGRLLATNDRFFVQDGIGLFYAFDATGKLLWKHDLQDERVGHVSGAAVLGDTVVILGQQPGAVVIIGPDGTTLSKLSLSRFGFVDNFVALHDGRFAFVTAAPQAPIVITDRNGKLLGRKSFPWSGFDSTQMMARQGMTAVDPRSDRWAFAFAFGDGFFGFRDTTALVTGHGVEPVELPAVIREQSGPVTATHLGRVTFASIAVAVSGDTLFNLFFGRDAAARGKVVDLYSLSSGAYLGSYRLPHPVVGVAVRGSTMYGLTATGAVTVSPRGQ